MKERLCIALDGLEAHQAVMLTRQLREHIGYVKVGLELFIKAGKGILADLIGDNDIKIFLDLKLHDIPAAVVKAVQAMPRNVALTTLHAAGGKEMLQGAVEVLARPKLLAVTCLTSLDQAALADIQIRLSPGMYVANMLPMIKATGVHGVVCSGEEVEFVKRTWPECFAVVPGLRPTGVSRHDQKRVATPATAIKHGADLLVIGRPITQATDPVQAAQTILAEMESALVSV